MISADRLQKALEYLATTDGPCAQAKALMVGLQEQLKSVRAIAFIEAQGGTVTEREARAFASLAYQSHIQKLQDATADYETMRNKRLTEELIVEVFRTLSANQRRGNV